MLGLVPLFILSPLGNHNSIAPAPSPGGTALIPIHDIFAYEPERRFDGWHMTGYFYLRNNWTGSWNGNAPVYYVSSQPGQTLRTSSTGAPITDWPFVNWDYTADFIKTTPHANSDRVDFDLFFNAAPPPRGMLAVSLIQPGTDDQPVVPETSFAITAYPTHYVYRPETGAPDDTIIPMGVIRPLPMFEVPIAGYANNRDSHYYANIDWTPASEVIYTWPSTGGNGDPRLLGASGWSPGDMSKFVPDGKGKRHAKFSHDDADSYVLIYANDYTSWPDPHSTQKTLECGGIIRYKN